MSREQWVERKFSRSEELFEVVRVLEADNIMIIIIIFFHLETLIFKTQIPRPNYIQHYYSILIINNIHLVLC